MSDSRRKFLKNAAMLAAYSAVHPAFGRILQDVAPDSDYLFVIKNGDVYHKKELKKLFVGIKSNGKLTVTEEAIRGQNEIDATGLIVSPGFIDILSDNSSNPESTYKIFESYKVTDGVTTALQLHGGHHNAGYYYPHFEKKPHYVNYGISTKVMNIRRNYRSTASRIRAVEENLSEGALAISHSIEYQPTPFEELLEYGKLAYKYQRPLFLHLRYSSESTELKGVTEAIELAQQTGAHIHIDHLNSTGGTFNMLGALQLIKDGRNLGLDLSTCVYPYSYWATYLSSKRFGPGWKERYGLTYSDLTVVGTGEKLSSARFYQLRKKHGILVAVPEGTMPLEETVDPALKEDFCMIGSDGGIERSRNANNHPRGAGCFATAVKHMTDIGISIEDALYKITELPTKMLNPALSNRGKIENGYWADLVLFDPLKINGAATMANPNQFSDGIEYVFVNGELACKQKELLAFAGKPIKTKAALVEG